MLSRQSVPTESRINVHQNSRLTLLSREQLVRRVVGVAQDLGLCGLSLRPVAFFLERIGELIRILSDIGSTAPVLPRGVVRSPRGTSEILSGSMLLTLPPGQGNT